jgi:hypothetical protein
VAELPPHLVIACTAFGQVARALDDFAEVLASAQRRMAGARDQAEQTFGSLSGARADRAGLQEPADGQAAELDARIGRLESAWDEQLAVAAGVRAQVLEAARRGAAAIRAAGRTSPTAGQNWFQDGWEKGSRWASARLDDLKGFMAEHAGWFRGLAKVLRVVGVVLVVVGAVLAIFGVGGAVMAAGFVVWGAADVLDTTVDWAEGKISGREFLFRAGTAIVLTAAGGAAAKVGAKLLERLGPGSVTGSTTPGDDPVAGTRGWCGSTSGGPATRCRRRRARPSTRPSSCATPWTPTTPRTRASGRPGPSSATTWTT